MDSRKIRQTFLDFFKSKGHAIVPSAPMVIKDDPTLMFTNAGMNQFKDLFLGNSAIKDERIADSQKCLRVSGKHNDLEEVGVDTYHHTMFEMLGNWSFGDYFKEDAINWAWELLTVKYGIDPNDLYITIFEGDKNDNLPIDQEAKDLWLKIVPEERILACDKKDNFWEMGETGPCGPCSEIHVDIRSADEKSKISGRSLVNKDHPQVIEIWNLVFMEFNRMSDGSLNPLPSKHIDTGMGFERLATVLQKKESNYDTDVFSGLINKIESIAGVKYTRTDSKKDVAIRVISDHVRAVAFSIADAQLPSNTGAGYVIRRILRRAIRYAYSFLNMKEAFIFELVEVLVAQMGDAFPELKSQESIITKVIKEEEENFLRTLEKGILKLQSHLEASDTKEISGTTAFELYDTFGFPLDLTALIASECNYTVNENEFNQELLKQKERSRAAAKIETGDWKVLLEDEREEFVGYDQLDSTVKITRYRAIQAKDKKQFQVVFNLTPFYPEGGGQVGDRGRIETAAGEKYYVSDTKKENNLIIHFMDKLPNDPTLTFKAHVDVNLRHQTATHHTTTHLLHEALRSVLGTHVEQKGSLVNAKHLRFDFSHFAKMSDEEISAVEDFVNQKIRENLHLVEHRNMPLEEAKEAGAMMLFGEKYGDVVRMIEFGESKELCGGTHIQATGEIGTFRITHETAVASGIRRVEAVSGSKAMDYINEERSTLKGIKQLLKNANDPLKAIADLQEKTAALNKELAKLKKAQAGGVKDELVAKLTEVNGIKFLAEKVDLDASEIKDIAFQLKSELDSVLIVFGSENDGKALLTCMVSDDLVTSKGLHAGNIVRELAKEIKGGGGGQPSFATAGGKDPSGIERALKNAENFLS